MHLLDHCIIRAHKFPTSHPVPKHLSWKKPTSLPALNKSGTNTGKTTIILRHVEQAILPTAS